MRLLPYLAGMIGLVVVAVAALALYPALEAWLGPSALRAAKAYYEATGSTLNDARLIPPARPDAENLAALPLFKMTPDAPGDWRPRALDSAMRKDASDPPLPSAGDYGRPAALPSSAGRHLSALFGRLE